MGRCDSLPSDLQTIGKLHLVKLRWVDGCYDEGGAYWGMGNPIYRAYGETETEVCEVFVRARGREDAKRQVLELVPLAKFYR
jgi:hypothetical protein